MFSVCIRAYDTAAAAGGGRCPSVSARTAHRPIHDAITSAAECCGHPCYMSMALPPPSPPLRLVCQVLGGFGVEGPSSSSNPAKGKPGGKDLLIPHRSSKKKKISWSDQPTRPSLVLRWHVGTTKCDVGVHTCLVAIYLEEP